MWNRFIVCCLIALSACMNNARADDADDNPDVVQCLMLAPWAVSEDGTQILPAEYECYDIDTDQSDDT